MKRILTIICIALIAASAHADAMRLYCQCTQEWWTSDDAAIAIYAYADGDVMNAVWPGERMMRVTGTDGMWYAEIDSTQYTNVIFVRVNGSGAVEDWGAKTQDLAIPTDGRNLFTITSTEAVWGDPGVEGIWSVLDESGIPVSNKDEGVNVYSVVGSATLLGYEWDVSSTATEMSPSSDSTTWTYTIPTVRLVVATKYEYKIVADHSWENIQYPTDGNYTLAVPRTGTYQITFTLTPTNGCTFDATLIEDEFPDFSYSKYAVLVNHERFVPCSLQPIENFVAQYLALVQLNVGDTIRMFTRGEQSYEKSMPDLEESGEYANFSTPKDGYGYLMGYYVCNVAGCYSIYFKQSYAHNSYANTSEAESVWISSASTCHAGEDYASNISAATARISVTDGHESVAINAHGRFIEKPSETLPIGSTVELEVFPNSEYMFVEWSDGSIQNKRRIVVTEDISLSATVVSIASYPLGLLVNGNRFIRTAKSETTDYGYQNLIRAQLTEGETFVVFNSSTSETVDVEMEAGGLSGNFSIADQTNTFVCNVSGCYDVYVKKNNSTLSETIYIGQGTVCNDGVPWTDPNTGYVYSVVGTENLFGTAWDIADTLTNMTPVGDGRFEYTLDSVTLTPEGDYQYKVIANHMWNVREYPSVEENDNYHITVEESGVYSVLFSLDTIAGCSATPTYLHAIIDNPCPIASGSCGADGDNLTWVLGCDSVLTISGEGEMPTSYSGTSAPWYQYGQAIKHINIEEGVTKLALYAFYNSGNNYPNVQTLSIPSTLGAPIENNFFYQCPLKTITINSDTIVGKASYSSGSSLQNKFGAQVEEYIFGGSVRSIANFAFYNQSPDSLRSIILPEGLEAIGNWAFGYIEHLTSVSIPSMVQTIGTDAFAYCSNLRSVELGEGLMTVNGQAFWMCDSLTRVTCNALTPPTLNQTAFDHNQNDTLFIPCEAKESYKQADYWKNFSKIMCADDTLQIIASGTCGAQGDNLMWVFDRDSVLTISGSGAMADWVDGSLVPWYDVREMIRTVIIEEGVTTIGDRAFYYCTRLTDVSYPTTLTSIGSGVFDFCSALPEIDGLRYAGAYLAGVPVMAQDTITTCTIRQGTRFIGHSAFHGCSQLKRITLPEGVTHILSSAFTGCNRLTKIDLPATVTDIQRYAFESDTLLTTFINRAVTPQTLPSSTSESAFYNCKLSKCMLYVPEESIALYQAAPYWQDFGAIRSLEDVPCILAEGTFGAQGDNLAWTVDCDYMLTISGSGEMEFFHASEPWAEYRYQLRKIVVEEGVTNLSNVFRLHNQVTEVSLPNTLRVIEAQAFDQCSSITHLELPESVDSIGEGVFYLCESLQEIRIPSRVTMINSSLFRGCRGLRSVEFPNGLTRILTTAFQYCNELNALHLPASLTFIGQEAFADCTGLDTIIVLATTPPEVTQSAFDNVPDTIPVFVPTASLRAYRNHEEWSYFKNIHGIDGDGPQTYTFTLTSAWQFIMLPTVFGLTQDDIVVDGEIEWGIYNSAQRASGRSGWQGFTPQNGFEGSQAYIVRARNGSATLTINIPDQAREQAAVTMAISYHPATREQNANWNFLGNPYPYNYDIMSALEEADIESPVTIWNGTGYDLFTPGIDLKTLDPFEAFFIQLPEGGSEVLPLSPEHIKDTSDSGNNGNSVADADGALPGYFTINTSKEKVRFSRGNLQYQASTATWQFAENQYDVIGEGNVNISATYDGWIDLFGWGTGDNPTKASTSKCDYSSFVDWGINAISNGGNTADMWRTLSANEWTYITGQRTNYESLCGRATVNGIQGFILLPDDWVSPGIPFQGSKDNGYELNQFTLADWQKMEAAGAVFLPACGGRTGTEMTSTAVQYWSTNEGSSCYAYDIITGGDTAFRLKTNQVERSSAFGVRLVK